MAQLTNQAKLCPHCANSVAPDAVKCPYCKADLTAFPAHEWPGRLETGGARVETNPLPVREKSNAQTITIIVLALVSLALAGFLVFGQRERGDWAPVLAEKQKEFQEKDQKIQALEAELAKLREGNQGNSGQLDDLKARLEESQKDLAEMQRKLTDANREIDRLTSSRVASAPPAGRRGVDPFPPPGPSAPTPAARYAEPGIYETRRPTPVYEEPSGSARVVSQIGKATQVTVVRSIGEWLEIRSKHGNPPGFIRADDAMFVSRSN